MKAVVPNGGRADFGLRLAELIAALSPATDLGMGQPMEHALRACLLAVRLGEALGLTESELADGDKDGNQVHALRHS